MFENSSVIEIIYWTCAVLGTLFFVIRIVLVLIVGMDHDFAVHASGFDGHGGAPDHQGDFHHADAAFKLISINTVTAFIAMFGWVGLIGVKELSLGGLLSFLLAWCAGFFTMALTAYLFKTALSLAAEGDTFQVENAVGKVAEVYQRIPGRGRGRIQVTVDGMLRELDAATDQDEELASFTKVTVEKVIDSRTVLVRKI